jgi:hypothetical protein
MLDGFVKTVTDLKSFRYHRTGLTFRPEKRSLARNFFSGAATSRGQAVGGDAVVYDAAWRACSGGQALPIRKDAVGAGHDMMMGTVALRFAAFLLLSAVLTSSARGADWDRFRGPNGSGIADGRPLPREIGPDKNVVWKTATPAGKSSPVLTRDRIFLTGHDKGVLLTLAFDRATGKELWRREAPGNRDEKRNKLNDPAAPTPATDGSNVYVFFAGYGLLSYDRDGKERWKLPLGPFTNFHGMAASPVLVDGKVVMVCDQDEQAYVLAVDRNTGKQVWKVDRPEMVHSFSTPIAYRNKAGPHRVDRARVIPDEQLRRRDRRVVVARARVDVPGEVGAGHRR